MVCESSLILLSPLPCPWETQEVKLCLLENIILTSAGKVLCANSFSFASDFFLQSKYILIAPVWLRLERIPCNFCTGFLWFECLHAFTCRHTHACTCTLTLHSHPVSRRGKSSLISAEFRLQEALWFLYYYNGLIVQACLIPVAGRQASWKLILTHHFRP